MNLQKERTFVIIKPDGIQRSLVGEIIKRFERTGLKLVALKMFIADQDRLWKHYQKDDAWYASKGAKTVVNREAAGLSVDKPALEYGKDIIRALVTFMSCGPSVAMVWEGNGAVSIVQKIVGTTEPLTADIGTIRADFTLDSYELSNINERAVRNLAHCADSPAEAAREMAIWFTPEEILSYRQIQEQILYDVNLDGILE